MKISICVPCRDQVHTLFTQSLVNLTNRLTRKQIDFELHLFAGSVICESRTRLVEEALSVNSDKILFLDSDIQFPSNMIDKLYSHNKDICAATYSTRYEPMKSVAFTDPDNTEKRLDQKGLHKIWAVGMGCMLIDIDVFNTEEKNLNTSRLSASTIEQLFEDTKYNLKKVKETKQVNIGNSIDHLPVEMKKIGYATNKIINNHFLYGVLSIARGVRRPAKTINAIIGLHI